MSAKTSPPGWPITLSTTLAFALHASLLAVDAVHPARVPTFPSPHGTPPTSVHVRIVGHDAAEPPHLNPQQAPATWPVPDAPRGRRPLETRPSRQVHGLKDQTDLRDSMSASELIADLMPAAESQTTAQGDVCTGFVPADLLDTLPRPYTAPDLSALTGRPRSGLPVTATLLIATDGTVRDVLPGHALLPDDQPWFADIRATFRSTRFTPGRLGGMNVASCLQISVELDSLVLEE